MDRQGSWEADREALLVELDAARRRCAGLAQAVAEAQHTKAALVESEEKYRQLFTTISDAILVFDAETHRVIEVNERALQLYDYTREEFLTLTQADTTAEPTASEESFREILAGQRRTVPLGYHRKRGGMVFPVEISAGVFVLGGRRVVCGVIRDITDRQRAEQALREWAHLLGERVKELRCLYACFELLERPGLSLPEVCQGLVDLTPAGWQYPESACARLLLEGQRFTTRTFRETTRKQSSPIAVHGRPVGALEVYYLEEKPARGEGAFLAEEQELLNALAGRLGKAIERRRAEAALRQSEILFQTLAKVSPVGIFRTDARGDCVYVNERWCEIAGISAEAALGKGWAQAIHPGDRERVFADWYQSAGENRPFKMEYRFQRPDGLSTWVIGQAMREPGDPDRAGGYVGAITDITDRKLVQEALLRSEASLKRAQQVAQIGSWHLDVTSGELTYSDEAYHIFRIPIGTPLTYDRFLETVHPDDRQLVDAAWRAALASGKSNVEYRIVVAGETKWISGHAELEFHGDGTPLRGVGTVQDITQHKAVDDALRAYTQQLDALRVVNAEITRELNLPTLLNLIMRRSTELMGGAGGTIYLRGEGAQALIPQVWAGHSGDWVREGQARLGEGLVGRVAERREGLIVNDYRSWPHARPFILERTTVTAVVAEPLICRDNLLGVIAIDDQGSGRRFTEQDRELLRLFASQAAIAVENAQLYEQVRRHAEELEQKIEARTRDLQVANADLETFAFSVSHDLRTPLISIDGFSRLLWQQYEQVLDARGSEYLQRVRAEARRMGELIDALLALARVSREPLSQEPVNLSALARAIAGDLGRRDPQRAAEVAVEDGLVVQGDLRLLRALLENLLGNAWKFTAQRRIARIEVGRLAGEVDKAVYFVRDNGAGFDMAYADKLFGVFQRLHTAEEFPGTGIGLATVLRIVQRHGGRVWAEGTVGMGATFFFSIASPNSGLEATLPDGA